MHRMKSNAKSLTLITTLTALSIGLRVYLIFHIIPLKRLQENLRLMII